MAPRSRRGGGKAAAAAAARRQWKVGDLVLAKVKGFPPWPATVSEPEKWGFTTDWKKVFVYFYGTKQIAFCNPADVEAFTEEKRKSLLGKLHGRGADFVRAVEEIIDCFEKSKQDGGNEGVEGTASNAGTCEVSVVKYSEKVETYSSIPDPLIGRLYEPVDRNGLNVPVDVPVAATEIIAPHDLGTVIEDAVENTMIPDHPKETKLATSNSRKRSREKPVQNSTIHKKAASFRKSRSSKKVDSSKFENLIMAVNDLSNKNGAVSDAIHGEPIRRNRRTRETLDNSVCHDMLSPVSSAPCVSNGSSEGNASDTVATDSDAVSMNEASTLDSTCETEHPGISVDYLKRDVQVSETLLACAKTVVKKKRKPNRKRVAPCPAGVATSSKIELGEVGKNKAIPSSPAAVEKFTERGFKADGDEHLPLVKRARVRMGKLSTEENGTDYLLETKKRSSEETSVDHSKLVPVLAGCPNNYPPYKVSLEEAREAGNGPQVPMDTAQFTGNESVLWNTKKFQLRGCSADGEAALPPSKRLHRALEAMSANAAEDDKINSANQRATMNVTSNGCSSSHQKCSHNIAGSELEMQEKKSCDDHNMASCETPDVTSSEAKCWESTVGTSISPKLRESKVSITEAQNYVCTRDLDVSSLNTQSGETEVQLQSSQPSTSFEEKHDSRSPERLPPSAPSTMEEQKLDSLGPSEQSPDNMSKGGDMNNLGDKSDGENSANGSESISEAKDIQCVSSPHDVENSNLCEDILCVSPPHNAENSNPSEETKYKSSPAELTKIDGMCEVVKDVQVEIAEKDIGVPYHDTSLKGLIAAAQAKRHLSHATSLSENFMDDKVAPDASHSPSITRMIGNSQKVSPRHLSLIGAAQAKRHLSHATSLSENFMDDKVVSDTSQSPSITRIIDNSQKVSPRHFSLIAAAQAKRHLSHATSLSENSMDDKVVSDTSHSPSITRMIDNSQKVSPRHLSLRSTSFNSSYLQRNGSGSPEILPNFKKTAHVPEMDKNGHLEPTMSHRQKLLSKWPSAEVNAALKSFEVLLGTLSRTKDSIGRATNLAIDCAKYGIAGEVVEILARNLDSESSLHRRVDLFFLVDSIIRGSRGQKGDVGDVYASSFQAALPRLLSAAAPPGIASRENRRQCLKVLKLWLDRKILPESIIRHHMQEIDDTFFIGSSSQRAARTERSLNDPVREMEGMLVDEYGSNANFQLPGFLMPRMREDGESDTDDKSFEAVTPEHEPETEILVEREATPISATAKHHHILEDVDGELEMEDVAPSCPFGVNSSYSVDGVGSVQRLDNQYKQHHPMALAAPPLPEDKPPSPPPLPTSPLPMPSFRSLPLPPPPPPPPPPLPLPRSFVDCADSNHHSNTSYVSSGLRQPQYLQSDTPSVNLMTSDTGHYYAPGYRDFTPQMQRPGFSSSSDANCSFPGPHGNNVQQMDGGPVHNNSYHLQPPPPMLSNQFSYIQPDYRAHTWNEASSSSTFTKGFQFGHDVHRENMYDSQDRLGLGRHEFEDRCGVRPPVHLGPVHSDNIESSYTPAPYYGPPAETIPSREWSYPPPAYSYQHGTPLRPPEVSGANGGPNFWRPR